MFHRQLASVFILYLLAAHSLHAEDNWPQFRGPTGQGFTPDTNLPESWGGKANKNVLWKSPLIGEGHASPIIWKDRVFVCTAFWPPGVKREKVIPEQHVLCYALGDGRRLWDVQIPPGPWLRSDFRSGPGGGYACPTPTTDGEHVFCVFGSAVIAALDFEGRIAWRKEIVPYSFDVAIGSSPVLYRDTLLMFCPSATKKDSRLVAYNKKDGSVKWQVKFPAMGFGHSTPLLIDVNGKQQLLVLASGGDSSPQALQSLDPSDGKQLWSCAGHGDVASPVYGGGIVFFDSGRGGPGFAADLPASPGALPKVKWKTNLPPAFSSPLIVDKSVYRLTDPGGVLRCFAAADGAKVYAEHLDGLFSTWASPIVDAKKRIFIATAGKSYVVQAGPTFKILATSDLGDGNHASPAVAGGRMILVGTKGVFCVGEKHD